MTWQSNLLLRKVWDTKHMITWYMKFYVFKTGGLKGTATLVRKGLIQIRICQH